MILFDNKHGKTAIFENTPEGKLILDTKIDDKNNKYVGTTKVLDTVSDKSFLLEWRKRVGDDEADRIIQESKDIGNSYDSLMFDYFTGVNMDTKKDELSYNLYKQSLPHLKHIQPIALQLKVFSHRLKMQGYIDCLCYYKGILSLLDFKNSKKYKKDEYLDNYYRQCTYYCMMLMDTYNIHVKQLVLFIAMRNNIYPDIRISKPKYFINDCLNAQKKYYCKKS